MSYYYYNSFSVEKSRKTLPWRAINEKLRAVKNLQCLAKIALSLLQLIFIFNAERTDAEKPLQSRQALNICMSAKSFIDASKSNAKSTEMTWKVVIMGNTSNLRKSVYLWNEKFRYSIISVIQISQLEWYNVSNKNKSVRLVLSV